LEMINNPHYLYRMTILRAISLLAPVMGSEITCSRLLPVVINASKDRVPNIKFNVAKVLQSLIPIVDQSVSTFSVSPFSFMLYLNVNNFNVGFIFAAFPLVLFSCLALNYCHRWWRKQSVPVWLSSLRIQMLMSVFLPLKPFSRLIM
ncbi:hypothetical protein CISIN_1g0068981mg, partial [Citrus sinensis]